MPGSTPHAVLSKLLLVFGRSVHVSEYVEPWGAWVAGTCRRSGLEARVLPLTPENIPHVTLPAIVVGGNGDWRYVDTGDWPDPSWAGWPSSRAVEIVGKGLPGSVKQRCWKAMQGHWRGGLSLMWTSSLSVAIAAVVPSLVGIAVGMTFTGMGISLPLAVALGVMNAGVGSAMTKWATSRIAASLAARVGGMVQRTALSHVLRLPLVRLLKVGLNDLLTVVKVEEGCVAAMQAVWGGVCAFFAFMVSLALLAAFMPQGVLTVLGASVVLAMIGLATAKARRSAVLEWTTARGRQRARLSEMVDGAVSMRVHGASDRASVQWVGLLRVDILAFRHISRLTVGNMSVMAFMEKAAMAAMLWVAMAGEIHASVTGLVAGAALAGSLMAAARELTNAYLQYRAEFDALARVDTLLKIPSTEVTSRPPVLGPIAVRKVAFRYEADHPWVLHNMDLDVMAGEIVWLKSASGSGKSTLLRLLAGTIRPDKGHVLVGGEPIYDVQMPIGYLPQGATLRDDSILGNLMSLSGGASKARILIAASQTGLDAYIATLPMGYSTRMTTGAFSGGQRQLILITGILALECGILLLDEPMSNMDWEMRDKVGGAIVGSGKTVIYVSHDIPLKKTDRIITPLGLVL